LGGTCVSYAGDSFREQTEIYYMYTGLSLGTDEIRPLIVGYFKKKFVGLLYQWIVLYPINKIIKLTKKAIELLDAVTSVPYSRKGLGLL
jgi:hypothetical protein